MALARRNPVPAPGGEAGMKKPRRAPATRDKLVRKALRLIERRLDAGEINCSMGDLIRLLEIAEPANSEPVCAGWVDDEEDLESH